MDVMAKSAVMTSQKVAPIAPRQGQGHGHRALSKDVVQDLLSICKDSRNEFIDVDAIPGLYKSKSRKYLDTKYYGYETPYDLLSSQAFAEVRRNDRGRGSKVRASKKYRDQWAMEDEKRGMSTTSPQLPPF